MAVEGMEELGMMFLSLFACTKLNIRGIRFICVTYALYSVAVLPYFCVDALSKFSGVFMAI